MNKMRILVTGHQGFVGKNLMVRLAEIDELTVLTFGRGNSPDELAELVANVDAVIHLAGENRPSDPADFQLVNTQLTQLLCDALLKAESRARILFTSSIQADRDNDYGRSKKDAEMVLANYSAESGNPVVIYRLPNLFGKWCKPEYNSVVATFCHHISQGLPIKINDESTSLRLVYIDDLISKFISDLGEPLSGVVTGQVEPEYSATLGELATQIYAFKDSRGNLTTEPVGTGLTRALYSTYMSYLRPEQFHYDLPSHADDRGVFVEMLKTRDSGQFSFFTAKPGIMRGSHYHHTKTEKFLIIQGRARFGFRHLVTNETVHLEVSDQKYQVVETIPGWVHDITNVGDNELIVLIWANEVFDREAPDTIARTV